jgi:hypothetical protein
MPEQPTPSRRRRKRKALDVHAEGLALLAETLAASRKKLEWHIENDIPVDAAQVSANVSLLKLLETMRHVDDDDKDKEAAGLAAQFHAKTKERQTHTAQSRDDLLAEYGLTDHPTPSI